VQRCRNFLHEFVQFGRIQVADSPKIEAAGRPMPDIVTLDRPIGHIAVCGAEALRDGDSAVPTAKPPKKERRDG
jgi:hypothetical protein